MNIAILILLLFAGVCLLLQAVWMARERLPRRAFASAILGLMSLAATVIWVGPALLDGEAPKLRQRVAAMDVDAAALKADKTRLSGDVALLTNRMSEAERQRTYELSQVLSEVAQTRTQIANTEAGLLMEPLAPRPPTASATDQLRAEIRNLATVRPRRVADAMPVERTDQTRELMRLKEKMAARLSTPNYDVEVYPDKELIRGRQGRYYVVDMKNAASGIRYFFDGGKYTLARGNQEFRSSLNAFVGDILSKFEGNVRYDLYVRGSADQKPYAGRFEPGNEFHNIRYVRNLGGDKYGLETSERRIVDTVRNQDLPDLRAAFMQKLVADNYPLKTPIILEGAVSPKTDDRDRNVELILFVDW